MRVLDSRRLTGPNLLLAVPGAILDLELDGQEPERVIAAWRAALAPLLGALDWRDAPIATRTHAHGVDLAFGAPIDVLYAATEVNEAAWAAAARALGAESDSPPESEEAAIARLRATVDAERKPWLLALADETRQRDVSLLADDRRVSVGLGVGSRSWPVAKPPAVDRIRWRGIRDIPIALVTGTNGKTTVARLLGAMAGEAGRTAGVTSTDRVTVGNEVVAEGDYSGPNGARTVLRDRRVDVAVLEVARGGMLRRGLAVTRATVALVTNVADDHLGEFGIDDLAGLADAKMVVTRAVGADGRVVLNADDPLLVERAGALQTPVIWFTLEPAHPLVKQHLAGGGTACVVADGVMTIAEGASRRTIAKVVDAPIAFGGAAAHNVANALAAIGVAHALGLPHEALARVLVSFASDAAHNPGRANVWRIGGVTAIVDFAHNPHGLQALAHMAATLPATRRAIVIGQAGDRSDAAIREFAACAWTMRPERVFTKEMDIYLRGRERGVIPALIENELMRLGATDGVVSHHDSELAAVRAALEWAREGDLLLLTTHAERDEVIELLERLASVKWKPGRPVDSARAVRGVD